MKEEKAKKQEKKQYVKPVTEKHSSIAVISGSGGCSSYSSRTVLGTYYH